MRRPFTALVLLSAAAAAPLAAQTDVSLRVGAIGWTPVVHDFVVQSIDAKPSLGPAIVLGVGRPIAPGYGVGLELGYATNALHGDYGTASNDLGRLRTLSATVMLDGRLAGPLRWRAGGGALHYLRDAGAGFLASGGTTRLLAAAGVDLRRPLLPHWDLLLAARYDFHRFSSPDLRSHGYSQAQGVQRVSVTVGLARRAR